MNFSLCKEEWTAGTLSDYYYEKKLKNRVILDPDHFLKFKTKKRIFQIIKHVKLNKDLYINFIIVNGISKKYYFDTKQKKLKIVQFCKELFKNIIVRKKPNNLLIVFDLKNLKYKLYVRKYSSKLFPNKLFNDCLEKIFPHLENEDYDKAFEVFFENIFDKFNDKFNPFLLIMFIIFIGLIFFIFMVYFLMERSEKKNQQAEYKKTDNNKKTETKKNKNIKNIDYPSFEDFQIEKCHLCFLNFGLGELEKKILNCGHILHSKCLYNNIQCPLCPKVDFHYQTTIQQRSSKTQYNKNPHLSDLNINKNNFKPDFTYNSDAKDKNYQNNYSTNYKNNYNTNYKNNYNTNYKNKNNYSAHMDLKIEEKKKIQKIIQISNITVVNKKIDKEICLEKKINAKKIENKYENEEIRKKKTKKIEGSWKKTNKKIIGSQGGWRKKIEKVEGSEGSWKKTNKKVEGSEGGWSKKNNDNNEKTILTNFN